MLDVVVLALLALIFLYLLFRWRSGRERTPAPAIGAAGLLAAFVLWWYLLGPLLTG